MKCKPIQQMNLRKKSNYHPNNKIFATIKQLADSLGLQEKEIQKSIKHLKNEKVIEPIKKSSKLQLTSEQLNYLISEKTLQEQITLSLKQRAIVFHRRFPEIKISYTTIRNFYKKNGVRYKTCKSDYNLTEHKLNLIKIDLKRVKMSINELKNDNQNIVYLDETIYKAHSTYWKAWAPKYQNLVLKKEGLTLDTLAAVVIISPRKGLEAFRVVKKSIKIQDLQFVLEDLDYNYKEKQLTIFLDNLRAHHSKAFKEAVEMKGWKLLFNAPYSSKFNCIEHIFSRVKQEYRKLLISKQLKLSNTKNLQAVAKSIMSIQLQDCFNSERRCLNMLNESE